MNPGTIIAELRRINAWRRGGEEIEQPDPKHIGEVLDAAADLLASLIASNTTLRRERSEARAEVAQLKGALALGQENCDAEYETLRRERDIARDGLRDSHIHAEQLEARVKELEAEIRRLEHENDWLERRRQYETDLVCAAVLEANARGGSFGSAELCSRVDELRALRAANAELAGALREVRCLVDAWESHDGEPATELRKRIEAVLARHASGEPAKHPDTERSLKHSKKLNGLAAWLEHEADVRKACATNEGDRWDAGRMSECAEAIREYAARKEMQP